MEVGLLAVGGAPEATLEFAYLITAENSLCILSHFALVRGLVGPRAENSVRPHAEINARDGVLARQQAHLVTLGVLKTGRGRVERDQLLLLLDVGLKSLLEYFLMVLLQLVTVDVVLSIAGHLLQRRARGQACRLRLCQVWLLLPYYCTVWFDLLWRD